MTNFIHPALLFILGALPIPFLSGSVRKAYLLLIPALAILVVLAMEPGSYGEARFIGQEILIARDAKDTLAALTMADAELQHIAGRAYERTMDQHTSDKRAAELISLLEQTASLGARRQQPEEA
jgi:hypothetical protein